MIYSLPCTNVTTQYAMYQAQYVHYPEYLIDERQ